MCDEDDGREDTTFLSNPWFYVFLAFSTCIVGLMIWPLVSWLI